MVSSEKDSKSHWEEINKLSGRVSKTEANVEALSELTRTGFSEIKKSLATVQEQLNRPPSPTNWVGIGTLTLASMAAMGTFMNQRIEPLIMTEQRSYQQNVMQQSELISRARWMGGIDKQIEDLKKQADMLEQRTMQRFDDDTETVRSIADEIRTRVLMNGFSQQDGDKLREELLRIEDRINRIFENSK